MITSSEVIDLFIKEVTAVDDISQTDFLLILRRYLIEYHDQRYVLLKICTDLRGRKGKYSRIYLHSSRKSFDKNNRFRSIGDKCFVCLSPPIGAMIVRHHIIGLRNWGTNHRINIVEICERCHTYFHPWLRDAWQIKQEFIKEIQTVRPRTIAPKASAYHS